MADDPMPTDPDAMLESMERRLEAEPFDPCPTLCEWARLTRIVEVAALVYGNWSCGEPISEEMVRLGEELGFEVRVP